MLIFAGCLAFLTFVFGYLVGRADGKDASIDLYVHEQNKRVSAENEIKHLERTKLVLEDKVVDLQKKLEMQKELAA